MARPPARAGGRSGLLTGGKSGKPNGYSLLSPKGHLPAPSPPSRWAGRYGPSNVRAAGQVTSEKYNFPHTTPPEKSPEGRTSSLWGSSPISSQEMGPRPGRPRFPAVPTAWSQTHKAAPSASLPVVKPEAANEIQIVPPILLHLYPGFHIDLGSHKPLHIFPSHGGDLFSASPPVCQ